MSWAARPLELLRDRGQTVLVLEDHPGGKLLGSLLGAAMEVGRFLRLAIGVAAAVGKMHRRGLVHKDIKPANILVNDGEEIRLTGFGIASRLPRERQPPDPPEVIAGTLAYMAPEQEAILEIAGLSRAAASEHSVLVKMQLSDGLPHILGDRVQLQQAILNLIMNAIEAMSEVTAGPRELLVGTSEGALGGVLVKISDTGPGLSPANLARIFEAFHTTKSNGLGMGLSICRSIVEAHGGRLWATPSQPRGAVFHVMLPPIGEKSPETPSHPRPSLAEKANATG
jgi:hypothetical protein